MFSNYDFSHKTKPPSGYICSWIWFVRIQLTTILFLAVFALQTFSGMFLMARFYASQNAIAASMCENKNRPKMKCHGKCQLSKALAKTEGEEKGLPSLKLKAEEFVALNQTFITAHPVCWVTLSAYLPVNVQAFTSGFGHGVFHPPLTAWFFHFSIGPFHPAGEVATFVCI